LSSCSNALRAKVIFRETTHRGKGYGMGGAKKGSQYGRLYWDDLNYCERRGRRSHLNHDCEKKGHDLLGLYRPGNTTRRNLLHRGGVGGFGFWEGIPLIARLKVKGIKGCSLSKFKKGTFCEGSRGGTSQVREAKVLP